MILRVLSVACLLPATTAWAGTAPPPPRIPFNIVKTDPTLYLGLVWTFGVGGGMHSSGTPGVTLKLLSTNKHDSLAAAGGVTYNFDNTFGCDLGLGYNFSGAAMTMSWDFCRRGPQFGFGALTKEQKTVTTFVAGGGGNPPPPPPP